MEYILLFLLLVLIIIKLKFLNEQYLVLHGNVIFKNFTNYYNFDNLLQDLLKNNIQDLKMIEKAYLKNGKLKVITSKPHIVINKGEIDLDELKKTNKNRLFIYNILSKHDIKIDDILYGIYINNDLYIVKSIAK